MELKPGLRLESATCSTQVVVVRAPTGVDVDLRCGGQPMRPLESGPPVAAPEAGEPTWLGKRYADEEVGIEVLCTRSGDGALSVGEQPLAMKTAKPLPSSD